MCRGKLAMYLISIITSCALNRVDRVSVSLIYYETRIIPEEETPHVNYVIPAFGNQRPTYWVDMAGIVCSLTLVAIFLCNIPLFSHSSCQIPLRLQLAVVDNNLTQFD